MSDEHELEKIRLKKMAQLLKLQKQRQEESDRAKQRVTLEDEKNWLLNYILHPKAKEYLDGVRARNPAVADRIVAAIMPPQVVRQLDLLLLMVRQGRIPRGVIPVQEIQYLERRVLGIKSKIMVKKRGEERATDLSSFLSGGK
ncbi:MAG: hypothetical protein Kow0069_06540 [Promethearchaeota archaeon]